MNDPGLPTDVPVGPNDHTTMVAVLDSYAEAGFTGEFEPREGPTVTCSACGVTSPAAAVTVVSMRRLEGASDPDDMVVVAAVRCPRCSTQGVLVLGYGPAASGLDADVLLALRDRRHESDGSGLLPDAAPDEAVGDAG
jgi:hypothetical protein